MPSETAIVHVIDDDEALRDSLAFLLRTADLEVMSHASAAAFWSSRETASSTHRPPNSFRSSLVDPKTRRPTAAITA